MATANRWRICTQEWIYSNTFSFQFEVTEKNFSKLVILLNGVVPLVLLLWDVYARRVGANPVDYMTRTTGMLTLIFLIITLALSPVRTITRLNELVKFRRILGLFAFFYGTLHLLTYVWFDRFFNIRSIAGDIRQRPFIAVGMAAFFLMLPLAITSTNKMVKRLGGKRWAKLHRLVYLAGVAAVVHFWLLVKSDTRLPVTFAFILFLLLGYRILVKVVPPESSTKSGSFLPRD